MWGSIPQAPGRVLNPAGRQVLRLRGYPHRQPLPASHLPPPPPSDAPGQAARTVTAHDLGQVVRRVLDQLPGFHGARPGHFEARCPRPAAVRPASHGRPTGAASCAQPPRGRDMVRWTFMGRCGGFDLVAHTPLSPPATAPGTVRRRHHRRLLSQPHGFAPRCVAVLPTLERRGASWMHPHAAPLTLPVAVPPSRQPRSSPTVHVVRASSHLPSGVNRRASPPTGAPAGCDPHRARPITS